MEEIKKKSNKGLIVLVVVLIILLLGAVGYICYDKFFLNEKSIKENSDTIENQKENLITENTFKLSDINCVGTDVCEKSVKLSYNNANHNVKLVKKLTNSTKYSIEVYIDNQLIDTLDGGEFFDWGYGEEKAADWIKNLDGYIYVINSKYLAFVYPKESAKRNWFLKFYDGMKPYQNGNDIKVTRNGSDLGVNGKNLTDLDNLEFDGVSIKYWAKYCGDDIKPSKTVNDIIYLVAQQHELVFDGNNINDKVVQTIKNAEGGGQDDCSLNY